LPNSCMRNRTRASFGLGPSVILFTVRVFCSNRADIPNHRKRLVGVWAMNMNIIEQLEERVMSWANISVHPHRFGGREFLFGGAEVGHVHPGGVVDIPFPRSVRDALVRDGLAEEHRWVPNSGWVTFRIRSQDDFRHAVWLMRMSYLRYASRRQAIRETCSAERLRRCI
jgi:hypothetical protein